MLRGRPRGQEKWEYAENPERTDDPAEALDGTANGATGAGVHAPRPKSDHDMLDLKAAPLLPDAPFGPSQMDAPRPTDAQPESGVGFDAVTLSESDLRRAAGAASGGIVPVEAVPLAGATIDTSSAELRADAVIHVVLTSNEKSPEARLTDNLVRNQIAVVRQEPAVVQQPQPSIVQQGMPELAKTQEGMEEEDRTRKERAVYFTNQAAVDFALMPTDGAAEPVKLYLVQAPVTQIATAVSQLQQEGGTVLAALPGQQPEAVSPPSDEHFGAGSRARQSRLSLGMSAAKGVPRESRRYVERRLDDQAVDLAALNELLGEQARAFDVNRATADGDAPTRGALSQQAFQAEMGKPAGSEIATSDLQLQETPGSAAAGQSVRSMALKRLAESTSSSGRRGLQEGQLSDDAVSAPDRSEPTRGTRANGRDGRPDQLGSWYAGEPVLPPVLSPASAQQRYERSPDRTLFGNPQELQKQLVGLTAGKGGERPLQFLFVLHGQEDLPPAAAETAEATPTTAEPAADAAPSDPP